MPRAVRQLIANVERARTGLETLADKTNRILTASLRGSRVYRSDFLQISLHQTLNYYRKYQQTGWEQLRLWAGDRFQQLTHLGRRGLREELSPGEQLVRTLGKRVISPDNAHYTSMFLTDGYLGESFRVGRETELERVAAIIDNWRKGYRGSVLITGDRMTGKSFFGEMIGHRFFDNRYVSLRPRERVTLAGRILEPTEDLETALKFVVKNSRLEPTLVWIDDLTTWQDKDAPLARDIKSLLSTSTIIPTMSSSWWLPARNSTSSWYYIST